MLLRQGVLSAPVRKVTLDSKLSLFSVKSKKNDRFLNFKKFTLFIVF